MSDLGPSWLASTPDGAVVTARKIRECTVASLGDGYFTYSAKGQRRRDSLHMAMVLDWDAPLVACGAKFWLVEEKVRGRYGHLEGRSAVRFRGPGARTAREAFTADKAVAR